SLADDLRACMSFRHWIVDYFSPETLRFRDRSALKRDMQNAPWHFRPDDYDAFFRAHGWRPRTTQYLAIEGERRNRPPPLPAVLPWWIGFASMFAPPARRDGLRKAVGYVWFEPA